MTPPDMPQSRVLNVGMDLDGVNFWFDRAYYTGCRAIGAIKSHWQIADRWDFYEDYGHTLPEFVDNCHTLADLGLLWGGPMIAGASTMWDSIADSGHSVHVITDRSFGSHPVASQVATRMWLAEHSRPYSSLTFTADKTAVATDIMLEDKIENYDALDATGCTPYLINRPWNVARGDNRRRVSTHEQFLHAVLAMGKTAPAVV